MLTSGERVVSKVVEEIMQLFYFNLTVNSSSLFLFCRHIILTFLFFGFSISASASPKGFGTETKGGVGGHVTRVTTLESHGPGSLRAALAEVGPRLIVFEVGGQIDLTEDLEITNPHVSVAGQTAPSPGITLAGAGIVVKTHDVILEHLRIRLGDGPGPSPHNRDGISVEGRPSGDRDVYNVLIDNCSIAWSIDEGIAFLYSGVRSVTVRDSIIAESLSWSLHPKGEHSMALLVGRGVRDVAVLNNLLAHNTFRNPVVAADATAFIGNNLIYDFGLHAIHVYGDPAVSAPRLAVVGNVGVLGDSNRGQSGLVYIPTNADPRTTLFLEDNIGPDGTSVHDYLFVEKGAPNFPLADGPPLWPAGFEPKPAVRLEKELLRDVGAWPAKRDDVDRRIIDQVRKRTGSIIDSPSEVGGLPASKSTSQPLEIPGETFPIHSPEREELQSEWLSILRHSIGDFSS